MVPHGAGVGVYSARRAGAEVKAWIKDHFPQPAWQMFNGRTGADWRIAQPKRLGLSDRLYRGDWLAMVPTSQAGGPNRAGGLF